MARGRLHRDLDLERTHAKQAEARLRQHLQRLERTCLHHLRLLSWEQRQLRRERERREQGERPGLGGAGRAQGQALGPSSTPHTPQLPLPVPSLCQLALSHSL